MTGKERYCVDTLPSGWSLGLLMAGLVLLVASLVGSCGGNTKTRLWKTVYAVQRTGEVADRTLADVCSYKLRKCREGDQQKLAECIEPCRKTLDGWIKYGRPAVSSGVVLAVEALRLWEAGLIKKSTAVEAVKRAGCGLADAVAQWGHLDKRLGQVVTQAQAICAGLRKEQ